MSIFEQKKLAKLLDKYHNEFSDLDKELTNFNEELVEKIEETNGAIVDTEKSIDDLEIEIAELRKKFENENNLEIKNNIKAIINNTIEMLDIKEKILSIHKEKLENQKNTKLINSNNFNINREIIGIRELKERISKAIEIRKYGWKFYILSFSLFSGTVIASLIKLNSDNLQSILVNLNTITKIMLIFCAVFIVEGGAIARKSNRTKDVEYYHEEKMDVTFRNVLTWPNFNEWYFTTIFVAIMFFPSMIVEVLSNSYMYLVLILLTTSVVLVLLKQIYDFIKFFVETFNEMVIDSKDRLLIMVAIAGTFVSLIALLK
ncbi:coiled-coil domain-containing protein [Marinilactibacillus sp. GCM10026970]|uniref:coiled-coil domain-containing protein n=1 Tax=Marinilactibacillus sp. GCM10026970 TaxID=3252642 RepID=UPI003616D1F6